MRSLVRGVRGQDSADLGDAHDAQGVRAVPTAAPVRGHVRRRDVRRLERRQPLGRRRLEGPHRARGQRQPRRGIRAADAGGAQGAAGARRVRWRRGRRRVHRLQGRRGVRVAPGRRGRRGDGPTFAPPRRAIEDADKNENQALAHARETLFPPAREADVRELPPSHRHAVRRFRPRRVHHAQTVPGPVRARPDVKREPGEGERVLV